MSQRLRPSFSGGPITRLDTLARVVGVSALDKLLAVAASITGHYEKVEIEKKDGSVRTCWNPSAELRAIQKRIVLEIFRKVQYPEYLHGSLPGRDYISNAIQHRGARWSAGLDIKSFFPNVTAKLVREAVWEQFFRCPADVSEALTALTTLDGCLPQGSLTASYLANLALWRHEPRLVADLNARGFRYTRYVDDITISSSAYPAQPLKTWAFQSIQGMLRANGLQQKRSKTEVRTRSSGINVVGLRVEQNVVRNRKDRDVLANAVIEFLGDTSTMSTVDAQRHAKRLKGRIIELGRFNLKESTHLKSLLDRQLSAIGQTL